MGKSSLICSEHFKESDFRNSLNKAQGYLKITLLNINTNSSSLYYSLLPFAIPSLKPGTDKMPNGNNAVEKSFNIEESQEFVNSISYKEMESNHKNGHVEESHFIPDIISGNEISIAGEMEMSSKLADHVTSCFPLC